MASTIHVTPYGTYHPGADDNGAWTVNDTRGYIDGGPPCDECGDCECGDCEDCKASPPCTACKCQCEDGDHPSECIGLSFAYVCLDSGDSLCSDCFAREVPASVVPCDCA